MRLAHGFFVEAVQQREQPAERGHALSVELSPTGRRQGDL
jgi:hypothetical protein